MFILMQVAAVLAVVLIATNLLLRGWSQDRRRKRAEERASAYMTALRRDSTHPEIVAMSDSELRDHLIASTEEVRADSDRRFTITLVGGVLTFFLAIFLATEGAGTRDFALTLLAGAVTLYGVHAFMVRRIREVMAGRGLDIDRLRVE